MSLVNTVLGTVEGDQLGSTLMHEHVFVLSPEIEKTAAEWDENEQRETAAVRAFEELKEHGIDTIVDLTVIGLGRFMPRILAVAERRARDQRRSPRPASTPTTRSRCTSTSGDPAPSSVAPSR